MKRIRLHYTEKDYSRRFKIITYTCLGVLVFVLTFVLFPPNAIYNKIFSKSDQVATPIFDKAIADSAIFMHFYDVKYLEKEDTVVFEVDTNYLTFDDGNYIIAVVSAGCKYCKQSCGLMHDIFKRDGLPKERYKILVWGSDNAHCARFLRITKNWEYETYRISPFLAVDMVYGNFPTFIKVSNGKVVGAFNYRGISESDIRDFIGEGN